MALPSQRITPGRRGGQVLPSRSTAGRRRPRSVSKCGNYRDKNLGEPALAALIQEDIGADPEDPHGNAHGTFPFDISNGTCGILTGLQIVDEFLRSHTISCALITASDADPGRGMSEQAALAAQLDVPPERIIVAKDEKMHTASLAAALQQGLSHLPIRACRVRRRWGGNHCRSRTVPRTSDTQPGFR